MFDETLKNDFLIHTNFLTKIKISLFYCCEKVFTLMNIWMIGKNIITWKKFLQSFKYDIADADYAHIKRICKDFEIKNVGEYHDLYVRRNTLLLADVFENFQNIFLDIYELDPTCFLIAPG